MLQAVIFDMDGVIVDSQQLHFDADLAALMQAGGVGDRAVVEAYAGTSTPERFYKFKQQYALEQPLAELISNREMMVHTMLEANEGAIKLIDGVKPLIDELFLNGIKMVVASSSSSVFIDKVLKKTRLKRYFKSIVSGENVKNGKPAPDIFLKAAKCVQAMPKNCIVIEDSANGVMAAKSAQMACLGYQNANSGDQDLNRADYIVESFKQVDINLLRQLVSACYS